MQWLKQLLLWHCWKVHNISPGYIRSWLNLFWRWKLQDTSWDLGKQTALLTSLAVSKITVKSYLKEKLSKKQLSYRATTQIKFMDWYHMDLQM